MSLIVETGQAGVDSESYASVADADTYHAKRGNAAWADFDTDVKEAHLRNATDYMSQVYGQRWSGTRVTATQALDWPRYQAPRKDVPGGYGSLPAYYDYQSIPVELKNACILLAFKAASGELAPDLDRPTTSETVGPVSVTYAAGAREAVKFRAVDNLLAPLLCSGGMNIKLVRV